MSKLQKTNEELIREDNAIVLRGYDENRWIKWAKNALHKLCAEDELDSVREIIAREYPKLSDAMRNSLASLFERKKVSVLIWNKPMETLRAVLFKILGTWIVDMLKSGDIVRHPCFECFPGAQDEFIVCSDADIYEQDFNHTMWFPNETMCVIVLGLAKKNNYLTEILNSFVRRRRDTVPRQRTIFLFSGTREEFAKYCGEASACELNRDAYITDWNPDACSQTNQSRHVTEPSRSVVEKTTTQTAQTYQQTVQRSDAAPHRYSELNKQGGHKNKKTTEGRVVLENVVSQPKPTSRQFEPTVF